MKENTYMNRGLFEIRFNFPRLSMEKKFTRQELGAVRFSSQDFKDWTHITT